MTYENQIPSKEAFFAWISVHMGQDLILQYQNVVYEIDKYCSRSKKIGTELFESLSLERVDLIRSVMESDPWYRMFHKRKLENNKLVLRSISRYLQELEVENEERAAEKQTPAAIDEPEIEEAQGRPESIAGNAIVESNNTTSVTTEAPSTQKKQRTYFLDEKENFYLWLGKDKGLTDKDRKRIVSSVRSSERFLRDNISPEYALFSSDVDLVRKSVTTLKSDAAFRARDEEWRGKYYHALERLNEYNNERDPNHLSPVAGDAGEEKPATLVALEENLQAPEGSKEQRRSSVENLSASKADEPDVKHSDPQPALPLKVNSGESDHIPEIIEEILRKECKMNHYGTTVSFIKGQLSKAGYIWVSTTEIKRILSESAWAKQETGAWKYIFSGEPETTLPKEEAKQVRQAETSLPPENSTTAQANHDPRSAGNNNIPLEMKRLDFDNLAELPFSKPQKLVYFGTEQSGPCTWKELYLRFIEVLYEDYPHCFRPGMSFLSPEGRKIDLGSYDMYLSMRNPRVIYTDGQQRLVETNLSAEDMARRMKKLLDRCNVDYENVEIFYSLYPDGREVRRAIEQKPDISSPLKNSIRKPAPADAAFLETAKTKPPTRSGTIVDAVISVLEQTSKPLSVREITQEIVRKDLYTFNTKNPAVVVSGAIRALHESTGEKTRAKRERLCFVYDTAGKRQFFLAEQEQRFFGKGSASAAAQAMPEAIAARCNAILSEDFVDGLRLNGMRLRKFRSIYEERYREALEQDDDALVSLLKDISEFRDGRIFAKQDNTEVSLLSTICKDVLQVLKSGASCAYPQQVFERYKASLAEQLSIYTNDAFRPMFLDAADGQIVLVNGLFCLPTETPNLAEDMRRIFQKCYEPLNYAQLEERVWYIPFSRVKSALNADPAIISIDQETYFYAPNYPISTQELSALRSAMQQRIDDEGYIVARDLRELMQAFCPNAAMDTATWKDRGIRDVMAWLLRDSFDFTGIVISAKGAALDTRQVFCAYCKKHPRVTLEELKELSAKLGIPFIYWSAVTEEMIRISKAEFVSKKSLTFDVDAIDKTLDHMCPGDYIPLKDLTLFVALPSVGFPWNGYLLESYLRSYSKVFRLEQFAANEGAFVGAMVRRTSRIRTMQELIIDALAHESTWTNEKEALAFIVQAGYRTQRTMAKSDEIVKQAKALREQLNAAEH